ncbi:hypothetical protein USDA257_c43670 [Sinorhizobium fredii USDA 257]|uniref:Uncharacterized protein n=1 Tax=Sinorhizobium fredii (strain USDA 257) TaxID=1185652 RepID=I3XAJ9_SINF2|nr:hypothetical protein USDA257_c43670 [Sinorhizobium fredii USDA 257]
MGELVCGLIARVAGSDVRLRRCGTNPKTNPARRNRRLPRTFQYVPIE